MLQSKRFFAVLMPALIVLAGCQATPGVNDLAKQEFAVEGDPPVCLALRGLREGQELRCQVFLEEADRSLWISGAQFRLPDGTGLTPQRIRILRDAPEPAGPSISFSVGLGVGSAGGHGHAEVPCHGGGGGLSPYGAGGGVSVPIWQVLGRRSGAESPRGLEFVYHLPETPAKCDGSELTVYVGGGDEQTAAAAGTDDEEAPSSIEPATSEAIGSHVSVVFALSEIEPQQDNAHDRARQLIREINFTMKQHV